jgi:hypothetical protein
MNFYFFAHYMLLPIYTQTTLKVDFWRRRTATEFETHVSHLELRKAKDAESVKSFNPTEPT